jgi:hypothetical protein
VDGPFGPYTEAGPEADEFGLLCLVALAGYAVALEAWDDANDALTECRDSHPPIVDDARGTADDACRSEQTAKDNATNRLVVAGMAWWQRVRPRSRRDEHRAPRSWMRSAP